MDKNKYNIDRIAKLARISLTESERDKYTTELGDILDYVARLQLIPTDTVPPTDHATGSVNVTRPDLIHSADSKSIISSAPGGNYYIPSVRSLWTS
jgi:aspartyl-tRNA(Asn)/glutamyl-tRNA(Gln) amidotransferase subunit C